MLSGSRLAANKADSVVTPECSFVVTGRVKRSTLDHANVEYMQRSRYLPAACTHTKWREGKPQLTEPCQLCHPTPSQAVCVTNPL